MAGPEALAETLEVDEASTSMATMAAKPPGYGGEEAKGRVG